MIADQWENHLFNNIFVLLVFGLDNMDNDSDGEFEGDLNSEGDGGCNNCNDLLDEMKDRENNFDVRILKLEEAHQLQITELQKHHIEESSNRLLDGEHDPAMRGPTHFAWICPHKSSRVPRNMRDV